MQVRRPSNRLNGISRGDSSASMTLWASLRHTAQQERLRREGDPLIKTKNGLKAGKYCLEIKFHRDPMLEKPEIYELKMALFDNYKLE